MNKRALFSIRTQAPTRADLSGGTLDIYPIADVLRTRHNIKHECTTLNMTLNLYTETRLQVFSSDRLCWSFFEGNQRVAAGNGIESLISLDSCPLQRSALLYFIQNSPKPLTRHFVLRTDSQVPRGSGLGGSSSLLVTLLKALDSYFGLIHNPLDIAAVAHALESGLLGTLAGNQDHLAAAVGGALSVTQTPRGVQVNTLNFDVPQLLERAIFSLSQDTHHSGYSNQKILNRVMQREEKALTCLEEIAVNTERMKTALLRSDWEAVGKCLSTDWESRKRMEPAITTPALDKMIRVAIEHQTLGQKVCGAASGGVVLTLCKDAQQKSALGDALKNMGFHVLKAEFAQGGLQSFSLSDS